MEEPDLSPELCRTLAHFNPLGMEISEEEVRSWAFIIWPTFLDYGYKNHPRALKNWWKRVTERDILQARERLHRLAQEREIQSLERHSEERMPSKVIDFASRLG